LGKFTPENLCLFWNEFKAEEFPKQLLLRIHKFWPASVLEGK
jgi:hypothetical protein